MPAAAASTFRAFAVLLFGAFAIGFAPILVRLADTGPAAAGFWRFLFAAPVLLLLSAGASDGPGRPRPVMLLAGVMIATDLSFWHYGIAFTSVANATVLSNLTPVVVTLAVWAMTRRAPSRLFLLAMTLAIGGAVVMALARGGGGQGSNPPLGNLFSAITALFYGGYFLAVREARGRSSAICVMLWSTLAGVPVFLGAALVLGEPIAPASLGGWAACLGLGLMHVSGQGSIAWALGRLPAPTVSVVVLVQPVVAAALGWLLFSEAVTAIQGLGAAVALTGVVLAQIAAAPGGPVSTGAQTKKGGAPAGAPPFERGA
jgi:drug/metabolite transporter (DMT)-like permease